MEPFALSQVRSLASASDLFLRAQQGLIRERPGYLVAETPGNPGFYWGNYLFFRSPPADGALATWEALFAEEFAHQPRVRHRCFGWDGEAPGEVAPFLAAGYVLEESCGLALTASGLRRPPRCHPELEVRPLLHDADWEAATQNQIECRGEGFERADYERFKRQQMSGYRAMCEAHLGHWYGGFLDGQLVADCGLYFHGELGRFQNVGTHPAHRRRGVCSALVFEVARNALAERPRATLLIVAEADAPAEGIYRSVGFSARERQFGLLLAPPRS